LTYYLITGLGAAALHTGIHAWQVYDITGSLMPHVTENAIQGNFTQAQMQKLSAIFAPTVGASGAVYGILLAFGMLFPNTLLYIYFLVPIKAKYLVIIFTALELYLAFINNPADNIAHFAHLGGMLFGFVLIKIWQRDNRRFY
ncbi:MAG TPA: DUF1751 domain-containing protein, partial [Bacteroidetes bacterium]|nr:DUF1751 domain-containing protein [Bacteroidota bacterium]